MTKIILVTLWCDLSLEEQQTGDAAMAKKQRLQCFAHTLQLVVGDDPVYLKAAALDPAFSLLWVEPHVLVNRDIKAEVAQQVKELILQDAAETEQPVLLVDEEEEGLGEGEGLFAAYHKRQKKDVGTSPALELSHYIDIADGQSALLFWALNMKTLPSLFRVAIRALAVPLSSAPVERVFSHGGVILCPHRAQMTDRLLANLIFCKCNAA
uniref:HAT C-terminal dimerisation domain-containing protein n=1 Tax=Knipowitschia caucasica TaxID=637954 RepID=A0AAV2JY10_KNICA